MGISAGTRAIWRDCRAIAPRAVEPINVVLEIVPGGHACLSPTVSKLKDAIVGIRSSDSSTARTVMPWCLAAWRVWLSLWWSGGAPHRAFNCGGSGPQLRCSLCPPNCAHRASCRCCCSPPRLCAYGAGGLTSGSARCPAVRRGCKCTSRKEVRAIRRTRYVPFAVPREHIAA